MNQVINDCLMDLNKMGGVFYGYAARVFVQSALLVILLFVTDLLLRKRVRAVFRYCLWLLVLVKLVLPPMLSLPTGIGYWVGDHIPAAADVSPRTFDTVALERARPSGGMPHVRPSENVTSENTTIASADTGLTSLTWQAVVFLLWLAGVLAFLAVLVQRILFVRGLVAASCPAGDELTGPLEQCRRQMAVRRDIKLQLSEAVPSPAVCGLLSPIVLMPTSLVEKLSSEGLRAALIHELAHIKRGDLWVNSVQTFLQVVYFYNPFVWFANSMIRKVCEEAVDETVLVALGGQAKHYSNTLIDIGETVFWKADLGLRLIGVAESKKALQWRIRHMLNRPIPKSSKLGALGITMLLVIAAILLPMARAQKAGEKSKPVSSDNQEEYTKPLHRAAAEGDIEQVKRLIASGADINGKDQHGRTALHCASWKGHAEVAGLLISEGARINVTTTMEALTPLHYAARRGSKQIVELLLSKGADINAKSRDGRTPLLEAMISPTAGSREVVEFLTARGAKVSALHLAAYMGDMEKLKKCLQDGTDVNSHDDSGFTALHLAACSGRKDIVEFLIDKGADIDLQDARHLTPLYYAIVHNDENIADLLLEKGANVNTTGKGGFTLLNYAIWDHNKDAAKLLLSKGARIDVRDSDGWGWTPLFYAIWENDKDMVELLISKGADIKAEDNAHRTPLDYATELRKDLVELLTAKGAAPGPLSTIYSAAREGDLEKVKRLVEEGADINAEDEGGQTPLFVAISANKNEVAKFLITKGADVNATGFAHLTPLHEACIFSPTDVIELLISKGADVNAKTQGDFAGLTPLHVACRRGRKDVAELLIAKGADLNAKVTSVPPSQWLVLGYTPLHFGALFGHKDVVELLLVKGADINVKGGAGQTPLHEACTTGQKDVVELLLAKAADINARNNDSQTPLHKACATGQKDVVELLMAKDADINAKDNNGQTPLSLAKEKGHTEIFELLLKHGAKE